MLKCADKGKGVRWRREAIWELTRMRSSFVRKKESLNSATEPVFRRYPLYTKVNSTSVGSTSRPCTSCRRTASTASSCSRGRSATVLCGVYCDGGCNGDGTVDVLISGAIYAYEDTYGLNNCRRGVFCNYIGSD